MQAALRTEGFTESVIREMTRLIAEVRPDDGINLAQGFPDFPAPQALKDAACSAILGDVNQYAITWGARDFREKVAEKTARYLRIEIDPEREITVTCGATEAMASAMLALINPGDEVVIFEPFYENYGPDTALCGAVPRFVPLEAPDWGIDPERLAAAFTDRTRAVVINTPNNPTGKVFTRAEIEMIGRFCEQHGAVILSDEIYEHILYDGHDHVSPAQVPWLRERTVVINGLSKTYSVTGWRVGYALAPPHLTAAIRKVHDFLTVGAAAPLQEAGSAAMQLPPDYYLTLAAEYTERRDYMMAVLREAGLVPIVPSGAYYTMVDISPFGFPTDADFARWLAEDIGVAVVPGSSFYNEPGRGSGYVRVAFPKRMDTLRRAAPRLLEAMAARGVASGAGS